MLLLQFSTRKKIILSTVVILLALAFGYHFFSTHPQRAMHNANAPDVGVAEVVERIVTKWDEFPGVLTAVEYVEIRPRVEGPIDAIHFEEGEQVLKGQPLFTIDPRPYEVQAAKTKAALNAAQAQAAYALTEFTRYQTLLEKKVVSTQEFDVIEEQYTSAAANVNVAEAAYKQALLDLEYTTIIAPVSGRISRAEITVGNLVTAGGDAPVLTRIVSLDPIYADFDVDEQTFIKYLHINNNDPEKLKTIHTMLSLGETHDFSYQGLIKSFDNSLNPSTGTIRVRAIFQNADKSLIPGLFVRIHMSGAGSEKAILITERAIGTDQNKKFVLVVGEDNKATYREIVVGSLIDGLRVVEKGLNAGEKIVINGLQRTRSGMEVAPKIIPMENPAPDNDKTGK